MEIGEEVTAMEVFSTKDPLCEKKKETENHGWKCRVGKKGDPGDEDVPTAPRLYENMVAAGVAMPSAPAKIGEHWDLDKCTPNAFPFQSHHLIPKMHLPDHDVCVWLAKLAKTGEYELTESTNYDTDSHRNGMALPFASNTSQWKKAKTEERKTEICELMMKKTGKQLHQGSHTYEDYGEEDKLHAKEQPGYLGACDQLLNVVNTKAAQHYEGCADCKKNATKPIKVRPLARVVAAMYQVSQLMGVIITSNKRFVSERAAAYLGKNAP